VKFKISSILEYPQRTAAGSDVTRDGAVLESPACRADIADGGPTPTIRVIRLNEVMQMTSLGKTTIYQLQSRGEFPRSVKITTQALGWIEEQARSWIKVRMAARAVSGTG
jgi:prophage regulatory protein